MKSNFHLNPNTGLYVSIGIAGVSSGGSNNVLYCEMMKTRFFFAQGSDDCLHLRRMWSDIQCIFITTNKVNLQSNVLGTALVKTQARFKCLWIEICPLSCTYRILFNPYSCHSCNRQATGYFSRIIPSQHLSVLLSIGYASVRKFPKLM